MAQHQLRTRRPTTEEMERCIEQTKSDITALRTELKSIPPVDEQECNEVLDLIDRLLTH